MDLSTKRIIGDCVMASIVLVAVSGVVIKIASTVMSGYCTLRDDIDSLRWSVIKLPTYDDDFLYEFNIEIKKDSELDLDNIKKELSETDMNLQTQSQILKSLENFKYRESLCMISGMDFFMFYSKSGPFLADTPVLKITNIDMGHIHSGPKYGFKCNNISTH